MAARRTAARRAAWSERALLAKTACVSWRNARRDSTTATSFPTTAAKRTSRTIPTTVRSASTAVRAACARMLFAAKPSEKLAARSWNAAGTTATANVACKTIRRATHPPTVARAFARTTFAARAAARAAAKTKSVAATSAGAALASDAVLALAQWSRWRSTTSI